ncbi:VOC family protein [Kitasatospora sp. DSM 101779]|uniref:VOC family protein n=1 Tax=Kitasatospora sp. DSM 101779 TaxID=2853165 RepID=UPI0021DAF931|nr:VOC family protein [Kitasatospora sp. DSM 101779]MCU7823479.1 VOC family protein [Kitasatospora sp. DSM 101779]
MPEVTARYRPGTPCWVDLMAKDQQAALDFYRDLFGWQGEVGPAEFGGYAICSLNGRPVAGIAPQLSPEGEPLPPVVWTTYLASDDADATLAAVNAAGGTTLMPAVDVGTVGRMLVASDPTGAVFGVWQPVEFIGAQVVNEPGALTWNDLHTSDVGAASAFLGSVFGTETAEMAGRVGYRVIQVDGRPVGGVTGLQDDPPGTPSHWRVWFAVDDTDSTVDALVKAGGTVLAPPTDGPAGRSALVADPQGAAFAVVTPA